MAKRFWGLIWVNLSIMEFDVYYKQCIQWRNEREFRWNLCKLDRKGYQFVDMILLPPEVELWAETHYSLYRRPYTEHCSVGPTKLIETTTIASTTRMKNDEDFYGWWRFLNLDF